jgi:hypothetical protein
LRKARDEVARKWVETQLKQLISPYLESAQPLPPFFTGYITGVPELPNGDSEAVAMAAKLGWVLLIHELRVEFWPEEQRPHEDSGSEWDIIAVRARKQVVVANYRLLEASEIVRSAVSDAIQSPDEMPSMFYVRWLSYGILDQHRSQLAELGWQPIKDSDGACFLVKL